MVASLIVYCTAVAVPCVQVGVVLWFVVEKTCCVRPLLACVQAPSLLNRQVLDGLHPCGNDVAVYGRRKTAILVATHAACVAVLLLKAWGLVCILPLVVSAAAVISAVAED
jgi:hypothetical protein